MAPRETETETGVVNETGVNQLGTRISIWKASAVLQAQPGREFRVWSDFGTALIETPNFSCTEPNA